MKKLVLKKDIVARVNGGEMNNLRGGGTGYTIDTPTCNRTCNQDPSCPGVYTCEVSCLGTCQFTCPSNAGCYTLTGTPTEKGDCWDTTPTGTMIQCM